MITNEFRQSRKKWWMWGIFIFMGGILVSSLFTTVVEMTNTTEFCISCHTMTINLEELKTTAHYNNASGVTVDCPDCHVPRALVPKLWAKLIATKDIYHEIIGTIDTREKYNAKRWRMANKVWEKMKATQSQECRHCHSFEHMDLSVQDRFARKKHERAVDRGETCIDCHQGIAHELPDEPSEDANLSQ